MIGKTFDGFLILLRAAGLIAVHCKPARLDLYKEKVGHVGQLAAFFNDSVSRVNLLAEKKVLKNTNAIVNDPVRLDRWLELLPDDTRVVMMESIVLEMIDMTDPRQPYAGQLTLEFQAGAPMFYVSDCLSTGLRELCKYTHTEIRQTRNNTAGPRIGTSFRATTSEETSSTLSHGAWAAD